MDQAPQSLPERPSPPTIVGAENHDASDGHTVTVWGTAEPNVAIQLWDWLLPVKRTVTDGAGQWSIALEEVEPGDHMYSAQATDPPSDRSNYVTVRVASPQRHWQARRTPSFALHWELPGTGIVRKLRARRHRPDRDDRKHDAFIEEEWRRVVGEQETSLSAQHQTVAHLDDPEIAARPAGDLSASLPITHAERAVETETQVDEPPIDIPVSVIEMRREGIALPVETLVRVDAPLDLGTVGPVLVAPPLPEIASARVALTTDPTFVPAERIPEVRPPIYRPLTQLAPPVPAVFLGTAVLLTEPPPASDPSPTTEPQPMKRFRFFRSTPGGTR